MNEGQRTQLTEAGYTQDADTNCYRNAEGKCIRSTETEGQFQTGRRDGETDIWNEGTMSFEDALAQPVQELATADMSEASHQSSEEEID